MFVSPAVLCALGFLAALAAVMQYSLRAYVPGSLEAGGFTTEDALASVLPLVRQVAAALSPSNFVATNPEILRTTLAEGLATYYQNVLRARAGLLTPSEAWEQIDAGFARGRGATRWWRVGSP